MSVPPISRAAAVLWRSVATAVITEMTGYTQIVYGLLCTREGLPVAVEAFDGNTADPASLSEQAQKAKDRFGIANVALVGHRGIITSARIREDLVPAGLDWISCLRAPDVQGPATAKGLLRMSLFDARDLAEISAPDLFPGERFIVYKKYELASERSRKREELLAATERELARIQVQVERRTSRPMSAAAIGLAVGAVLGKRKMAKHFDIAIGDSHLSFKCKNEEIEKEARLDGLYVIRTSLPAGNLGAKEAVQVYSFCRGSSAPSAA
jgi:hypothetical protein